MKILLIGSGVWGKNYIKTFEEKFSDVQLVVANRDNWKELIHDHPNGVIIATPPNSHLEIALCANEIPVMLEKPAVLSSKEIDLLAKRKATILVNYIHLFTEGYQKIKSLVNPKDINHIRSTGYNDGPVRVGYSSLWDYGPHDLSMILDLLQEDPKLISCREIKDGEKSNYQITMSFSGCGTNSIVGNNLWSTNPMREIVVNSNGIDISYNDRNRPYTHMSPLENSIRIFLNSIDGKHDDRLGLLLSRKITKILELCDKKEQFVSYK